MAEKSTLPIALRLLFLSSVAIFQSSCVADRAENSNSVDSHTIISADSLQKNADVLPKNIILFVGDGMGVSTVTAARIFDGQSEGKMGEEHSLAFEDFRNVAMIKTYNTNAQVPDSAGTATALMSGYKTNIGAVNVLPDPEVAKMVMGSCLRGKNTPTLTDKAKASGRSVGIISTARITHATPAAMYGHSVDRGWETDDEVNPRAKKVRCKGLATQLLKSKADIILGGGTSKFTPEALAKWQEKDGHIYVSDAAGFRAAPKDGTLLGLFTPSHMSYEADRDNAKEPSLAEMTRVSIEALSARGGGYVMLVEAGRVDHAHHGTNAYRALRDMQALNEAVKVAKAEAGDDTLIIVTADHSHVFTMAGYPKRGNPILGLVRTPDPKGEGAGVDPLLAEDGKPYTTLGYHNGPNVREADSAPLTDNMVQDPDFQQQTAVHLDSETHAGEDVPLYASGPGAQNFYGVMEQDEIGQIIHALLEKK